MRDITELVDEFVEEIFEGSIVSVRHNRDAYLLLQQALTPDDFIQAWASFAVLVTIDIPRYLLAEDEEKKKQTMKIFEKVNTLRAEGAVMNNPNALKEATFYKAKALYFEERAKQLEEQVMALQAGRTGIK